MPDSEIPDGITREDVLEAISALKAHSVDRHFFESERYDVIHEGERFAPRAVIGVAARRIAGRILEPKDFSGGIRSRCYTILRRLGFTVELKSEMVEILPSIPESPTLRETRRCRFANRT
jgi:lipoate-protein ligase A